MLAGKGKAHYMLKMVQYWRFQGVTNLLNLHTRGEIEAKRRGIDPFSSYALNILPEQD